MAEVADAILADAENVVKIEVPPEALETAMDGEEPATEDQEEPENASETLYIQNLNDKVKLTCMLLLFSSRNSCAYADFFRRREDYFDKPIPTLR